MLGLRRASSRVASAAVRAIVTLRFPHVVLGEGIRFNGLPLLNINRSARVSIGAGSIFTSKTSANFVGLFKRSSIYVGPDADLIIGERSGFSGVSIYCSTRIEIGSNLNCGGNVSIWDTDFHPLDSEARRVHDVTKINRAPIEIGPDVFIGAQSIILKGTRVGARSIIGAGSVVSGDIPPDEVWAGNPIRRIRSLLA
jgi:carbonic anhydrase/acetyltransferase-like protein (isoleucine patch superfamily)